MKRLPACAIVLAAILVAFLAGAASARPARGRTSSCTDGRQNGDELGVDCGGAASACPPCTCRTDLTRLASAPHLVDVTIGHDGLRATLTLDSKVFTETGSPGSAPSLQFVDAHGRGAGDAACTFAAANYTVVRPATEPYGTNGTGCAGATVLVAEAHVTADSLARCGFAAPREPAQAVFFDPQSGEEFTQLVGFLRAHTEEPGRTISGVVLTKVVEVVFRLVFLFPRGASAVSQGAVPRVLVDGRVM